MKDDASPLHSTPLLVRPLIAFTPLSLCEMKITRSHLPSSREITRLTDRSHVPPSSSPRRQTQSGRRERAKAASCSVFLRPKRPTATTEARLSVLRSVGWEHTNYITNARAGGKTEREREKGGREGRGHSAVFFDISLSEKVRPNGSREVDGHAKTNFWNDFQQNLQMDPGENSG